MRTDLFKMLNSVTTCLSRWSYILFFCIMCVEVPEVFKLQIFLFRFSDNSCKQLVTRFLCILSWLTQKWLSWHLLLSRRKSWNERWSNYIEPFDFFFFKIFSTEHSELRDTFIILTDIESRSANAETKSTSNKTTINSIICLKCLLSFTFSFLHWSFIKKHCKTWIYILFSFAVDHSLLRSFWRIKESHSSESQFKFSTKWHTVVI